MNVNTNYPVVKSTAKTVMKIPSKAAPVTTTRNPVAQIQAVAKANTIFVQTAALNKVKNK